VKLRLFLLATLSAALAPWAVQGSDAVDYLREIKPILAHKCFACHGALKQEANLRLDAAPAIHKGGDSGPAVVPAVPLESPLWQRVSSPDKSERMPPEGEGEPLDAQQLAKLKAWIEQGAPAPDESLPPDPREHWAYKPPVAHRVPVITKQYWPLQPLDAFVAAQHERLGLVPSNAAPRHVLLRRVYLDLIGLPPAPDELVTYSSDQSPDAYERVVDRLLHSPEYGQRWGRHWMDVWRYSDWAGYKQEVRESQRHIWRWRDWIIESLNADKPYDQMIVEMLAGDEIAPGNQDVLRATGFLVRNRHNSNRNIWLDATVEHTCKAFLGMTLNCARCHDHKYDPIEQKDYYRVRAIFEPHDVVIERLPGQPDLLQEGFVRVFDGKLDAPTYLYIRGNEKMPDKEHPVEPGVPAVVASGFEIAPVDIPEAARRPGLAHVFMQEDIEASVKSLAQAAAALKKAKEAAGVESIAGEQPPPAVALAEARHALAEAELDSIRCRWTADLAKQEYPSKINPQLSSAAAKAERLAAVQKAELAVLQGEQALATSEKSPQDDAKAKAARTKAEKDLTTARENLKKACKEAEKTEDTYTPVAREYPETSTGRRLALASWIARPDNPLTARVAVNHIWLRHFGAPLVENVFDFGLRSPRPELGDLLDWLSIELVSHHWNMKHVHRQMVTSSTYRLSSSHQAAENPQSTIRNPQLADQDNRFLWRMNTRRLEAEIVRDCLLAVGGSLDLEFGGPDIDQQLGEQSRRRSLYFRHAYEKQMQFLMLFDAANVNECYRRSESVIPQQALAIANSSLSLGQSRLLAAELSKAAATSGAFIDLAFKHILSRSPTSEEAAACQQFLSDQAARLSEPAQLTPFEAGKKSTVLPAENPQARSRENLVHVLLNHNDFVTIR
jgi:hypothetical protein